MPFNLFKKRDDDHASQGVLDFSSIDSREKATKSFEDKQLVKLYLMPLEFGGDDIPDNILYVPEFVHTLKSSFDTIIENLLSQGKVLNYVAEPEYKGNSFIPSKLHLKVDGDTEFSETIAIW